MKAMSKARLFQAISVHLLAIIAVIATVTTATAQTTTPKDEITFTKDIAPILQRSCQTCHRPGSIAPMSLLTYEEARPILEDYRPRGMGEPRTRFIDEDDVASMFPPEIPLEKVHDRSRQRVPQRGVVEGGQRPLIARPRRRKLNRTSPSERNE